MHYCRENELLIEINSKLLHRDKTYLLHHLFNDINI